MYRFGSTVRDEKKRLEDGPVADWRDDPGEPEKFRVACITDGRHDVAAQNT
jgi:hypothetical protein